MHPSHSTVTSTQSNLASRWSSLLLQLVVMAIVLMCGMAPATAAQANRLALIIGNDKYRFVPPLQNAVSDATTMAEAFERAGYKTTIITNRDLKSLKDDLRTFKRKIQGGDEVVLFYAGHGTQMGGDNYLLPIDVRADSEDQVKDDALMLSQVLADLRTAKPSFTLAVIDACRDNPFASKGRAIGGRGLAGVAGATGQMVIYSAGEGQQALDRLGAQDTVKNGLFTRVFVKEMTKPGLPIDQVLRNVRVEVNRLASGVKHEQVPALYDQVLGTFFFYPPTPGSTGNTAAEAATSKLPVPQAPSGKALDFSDLKEQTESWGRWQEAMKSANDQVLAMNNPAAQMIAWERFIKTYQGQNNPYSEEDEALMSKAQQALQAIKNAPKRADPSRSAGVPGFRDCDTCPEMVWLPSGKFSMGSADNDRDREKDEGPVHAVSIGYKLAVGRYPITVDEFTRFVQETNYQTDAERETGCFGFTNGAWRVDKQMNWRNPGRAPLATEPVVCTTWNDTQAYLAWLNRKSGKKRYRLLSEAEWEYAARGGTSTRFTWGDEASAAQCEFANGADQTVKEQVPGAAGWAVAKCNDSFAYLAPVGRFKANAYGLHDMNGNAWQWLQDVWHENYEGAPSDGSAWTDGGDGNRRVLRGGSWYDNPRVLRNTVRNRYASGKPVATYGFRVARTD